MNTTNTGREAEEAVAEYLHGQGYKILDQNWRTRWCEIDVVAQKGDTVFFVEVKYRRTSRQGDGLEYITNKKLQQMSFAAELWVSNHRWQGEYYLAAASVAGDNYQVTNFIEL
jgi:uncharacterized protein (TIGR00252 family)